MKRFKRMYVMKRFRLHGGDDMTDSQLYALMQSDPKKGRRALIDQYSNLVYAIVLNKLKSCASREDIEDCVSDVFVEIFRNTEKYTPENGTFKGFLSTIAKRTAVDAWRKLTYRQNSTSYLEEDEGLVLIADDDPEAAVTERLQKQRLWEVIKNLGEPDTSIIIRQYFYEQTAKEIGKALSMTADAVQKRSVRARARMKEILEADYGRKGECCEY